MDFAKHQKNIVYRLVNTFLELITPTFCCHCQKYGRLLCVRCFNQLQITPFSINLSHTQSSELPLESITTTAMYAGPMSSLIKSMKFQSVRGVCEYLAQLTYYTTVLPSADIFCPVPLHPQRKNERGFDQAYLISKHLAKLHKKPLLSLVTRKKHLPPQSSVADKPSRLKRLKNTYQINKKYIPLLKNLPSGVTVLLIDDVYTTGATLQSCAKAIKNNNSKVLLKGACMARD